MKKIRLGILGATSLLAKDVIAWLIKWHFPYEDIYLYDTKEYCGTILSCKDKYRTIQEVNEVKLATLSLCFICDETCYTPEIKNICYFINLTQYHEEELMVLPPCTLHEITGEQTNIWIPSASICMLFHLLEVARKRGVITCVDVTTMHSAAEMGMQGCNELHDQVLSFSKQKELEAEIFPLSSATQSLPLLFQVLPQTSKILPSGEAQDEVQLQTMMKKFISEDTSLYTTCVRIATMRGLALSMHLHFKEHVQLDDLMDAYASSTTCVCFDDKEHNMYPILADVLHDYRIFIGRMRCTCEHDFLAWAVCDDLSIRCGAAVQTAFYLYHNFLKDV